MIKNLIHFDFLQMLLPYRLTNTLALLQSKAIFKPLILSLSYHARNLANNSRLIAQKTSK